MHSQYLISAFTYKGLFRHVQINWWYFRYFSGCMASPLLARQCSGQAGVFSGCAQSLKERLEIVCALKVC